MMQVLGARHLDQLRLDRVIDQIENELGVQLFGLQRGVLAVGHPDGSSIDDDVERSLGNIGAFQMLDFRLPRQRLRCLRGAVDDEDLSALRLQAESRRPRHSTRADDEDARARQVRGASPAGATMPPTSVLKP